MDKADYLAPPLRMESHYVLKKGGGFSTNTLQKTISVSTVSI